MATERVVGDLGRKLREARERRGLSLHQIADRTKISAVVLEGLERNDISRLPGGIFGRAFVRAFSAEVGLDPEAAIQEFIVQFPQDCVTAGHPRTTQIADKQASERRRWVASSRLRQFGLAVPVAVVVVYLGMQRGTGPVATARLEVTSLARSADGEAADTSLQNAVASSATPTAPVVAPAADQRVTIALRATRSNRLSAIVDGETVVDRRVQPGEQRTLEVRHELLLTTDDGGGVEIVVNGVAAKPIGRNGESVTRRLTPENLAEFLQSRDWPEASAGAPPRAPELRPAGRGGSAAATTRRPRAPKASRTRAAGDSRVRRGSRAARPAAPLAPR